MGKWTIKFIKTIDGSFTLYSNKYNQNFHSVVDGALNESLQKHILISSKIITLKDSLNILDICFGLGYNTFVTIYYYLKNNIKTKVCFYSPEFDEDLISSLDKFSFPKEFDKIKHIINEVAKNKYYKDEQFEINIYIGDARTYIKTLNNIDIVYQDAFSSEVNKELWTQEYFKDIKNTLNENAIITTYSIATPIRLAMSNNNLYIYEHILNNNRKATISSTKKLDFIFLKYINMKKKILNNPNAKALRD